MANTNYKQVTLVPLGNAQSSNWQVDVGNQSGTTPGPFPNVVLPEDTGPYLIHFKLSGNSGVKFADDPISVQAGGKPSGPGVGDQITAVIKSTDGRELFILDKNTKDVKLHYKINVDGHGPLDPIIENGGGTSPPLYANFLANWSDGAIIALAVVLVLASGFIAKRFL